MRTGSTESGSIAELSLVDAQSAALFAADFSGDGDFGCAKVNAGRLQVPQGASCLNRGSSVDWAFLRRDFLLADKPIAHATLYATATDPEPAKQYVYKASLNGSPAFVVPAGLFGIRPLEPGYAKFRVKPQPGDLERASITVPTVRGTVGVAFDQASGGAFRMAVQIPGNTSADLSIPADDATTTLYVNQQPRAVTVDSGYATLSDVGAGCQLVSSEPGADPMADELLASICAAAP